jgi:transposase
VNPKTVSQWRRRFAEDRLDGLYDEPRVGRPRSITDAKVETVVVQTLETKPKARTHWSTRKMASKAGISHSSVGRIWRAHGLKPHIVRGFKLSNDPQFIDKVRDIVGLYMNPPSHAVVLSFDEKPQIQALQRAQPILPMDIGMPERQTHNYLRHGTLDLFAALDVATFGVSRFFEGRLLWSELATASLGTRTDAPAGLRPGGPPAFWASAPPCPAMPVPFGHGSGGALASAAAARRQRVATPCGRRQQAPAQTQPISREI